ncbi:MAG: molybdopterin-dependent oxidoreductase [Deltaproteobacteria bacterium]|nr:molybdopterin-dependent oxidoreductase [Deltaproteobacteria bacterium]
MQYRKKYGELKGFAEYIQPSHVNWDDQLYRGDAYGAFAWAAYIAEVSVDTVTYCCTVDRFTAVQEVGRVVHPLLAEGQIIGGVTQGIGYALYERVVWKDGRMANNSLTNYIIPTSVDTPSCPSTVQRLRFSTPSRMHWELR